MTNIFEKLEEEYSQNFSKMSTSPEGVRFLKIRTLIDVETLKASSELRDFLKISESQIRRSSLIKIREKMFYNQALSNEHIDELLRRVYHELKTYRGIDFEKIKDSLLKIANEGDEYWNSWTSVYRDDIRQHIQHHFVRTTRIQSYDELLKKLERELNPVIKGYVIISWYNQWSSACIEDFILSHPKVVPTARRIDKVDFFFLDIPFDLKITFIPLEYIPKKGFYRQEDIIQEVESNPQNLIKWFYENQGEMRFSDSHRIFIVLVNKENLEKSWKLKASLDLIQKEIAKFLEDKQSKDDITKVKWSFSGKKISGQYETYSDLILIKR